MFSTMPAAMGSIKGGLVRAIAVSSLARVATLPDVPTVIESGVTGYEPAYWYGVFVPAATPKDVVAKLADAVAKAVRSPDVASNLAGQGASPATMTSDQFAADTRLRIKAACRAGSPPMCFSASGSVLPSKWAKNGTWLVRCGTSSTVMPLPRFIPERS